jgi:hypothetical protein
MTKSCGVSQQHGASSVPARALPCYHACDSSIALNSLPNVLWSSSAKADTLACCSVTATWGLECWCTYVLVGISCARPDALKGAPQGGLLSSDRKCRRLSACRVTLAKLPRTNDEDYTVVVEHCICLFKLTDKLLHMESHATAYRLSKTEQKAGAAWVPARNVLKASADRSTSHICLFDHRVSLFTNHARQASTT